MKRTIVNPIFRETITFLTTAAESGGTATDLEISLAPGGGIQMHHHTSYVEKFTAVVGDLYLGLKAGRVVRLSPGESYLVKKNELHRFFNPGDTEITFRNEVRPGHQGFEYALRILQGLAIDGLCNSKGIPKSLSHTAVCGMMSDMRLPGLLSLAAPLMKAVANRARKTGVEQQLVERYCQ